MSKKTIVRAKKSNSKRLAVIALVSVAILAVLWSFFGSGPKIPIHSGDKSSSDL